MTLYIPGADEYVVCKEQFELAERLLETSGSKEELSNLLQTFNDNLDAVRFLEAEFGERYGQVYGELSKRTRKSLEFKYVLMDKQHKYAQGVKALIESCESNNFHPKFTKSDGSTIYRSLTFNENSEARVNDYESYAVNKKLDLFNKWLDSCTGVAYKAGSNKFKIIPECSELITIDPPFSNYYISVNYDNLDGKELDLMKGRYGQLLTKEEVLSHPAWNAAVEHDRYLLKAYTDIVFYELKEKYDRKNGMSFWIRSQPENDELRALFIDYLDDYSNANGNYDLNNRDSFFLLTKQK